MPAAEDSCFWSGQAALQLALCSKTESCTLQAGSLWGFSFVLGYFSMCDFCGLFCLVGFQIIG